MTERIISITAGSALALMVAGCATSGEAPVQQLARAESSIEIAEQSGAREYSATALDQARDKLVVAERASREKDYETAYQLSTEAELDAEFARAKASRVKAENSLEEIQQTIETLRREMDTRTIPYNEEQ